jgi:phosphonate transport system substrate-binding protein
VRELVLRALEKDPAKRFGSAEELERALETVLAVASKDPPSGPSRVDLAKRETAPIAPSMGKETTAPPPATAAPAAPPPLSTPAIMPSKTDAALIPEDTEMPRRRFSVMTAIRTGATVVIAAVLVWVFWPSLPIRASATITLGLLPDRRVTTNRLKELQPLAKFLEKATGKRTDIYIGGSYQENVDAFVEGRIQVAQFGGVTYVLARQKVPDCTPLVQRESDRHYHSVVIAHTGAHIRTLHDLRNKKVAFVDPLSTSGWVVPGCALLDAGIEPRTGAGGLGSTYFTHAHDTAVEAVAHGEADAAAVDEGDYYKRLEDQTHHLDASQLHVVWTSPEFPDDVWVASPSLDEKARERVKKAFLSLDMSKDQDRMTLVTLEARGYVPARDEDYDDLRAKVKLLQSKDLMSEQ